MSLFRRHPTFDDLDRLADGETSRPEAERLQGHLRECVKCRDNLAFLLEVRRVAKEIRHPSPPRGMLREILERRAAGERVILPVASPPARRLSPRVVGPLVVVLLLMGAAAALLVVTSGEVRAGASELRFLPERPRVGQRVEVEFRAASRLAAERRVRVRGSYRTAEEDPPRGQLGSYFETELERTGDGTFRGTLWLPASAVYAAFAVEDTAGAHVESRDGRLWEVVAHDEAGRPVFAALRQRFRAMEARQLSHPVLETARRMTELYPEEPEGWLYRLAYEERLAGPEEAPRLREHHRAQLVRLEQLLARAPDPGGSAVAALADYARRLGEEESAERWRRRLEADHPDHPAAQRNRLLSIVAASGARSSGPGERLRALEVEWDRAGAMDGLILDLGFDAALASGDPGAIRRWAGRHERHRPEEAARVAERLVGIPELRREGMALLRRHIARLEEGWPEARPLDRSAEEHRRHEAQGARRALAALGRGLVAEGRREAALDTLALAAAEGWDPRLFRALAEAHLAAGDAAGALRLYALAQVDPLAPPELSDEARRALGPAFDPERWRELLAEAGREMRRRLLAGGEARWVRGDAVLRDAEGGTRGLRELLAGGTSLVAYWSRLTGGSLRDLPALDALGPRLRGEGGRLITITDEPPSPGLRAFLEAGGHGFPVLHDADGGAEEALGAWWRPWYLVVDAEGRVRYGGADLREAFRRAALLGRGEREAA